GRAAPPLPRRDQPRNGALDGLGRIDVESVLRESMRAQSTSPAGSVRCIGGVSPPPPPPLLGLLQNPRRGQVVRPSFSISRSSSPNRRPRHCPCGFAKATIFPARRGSQRTRRRAPTRQSNRARRPGR